MERESRKSSPRALVDHHAKGFLLQEVARTPNHGGRLRRAGANRVTRALLPLIRLLIMPVDERTDLLGPFPALKSASESTGGQNRSEDDHSTFERFSAAINTEPLIFFISAASAYS